MFREIGAKIQKFTKLVTIIEILICIILGIIIACIDSELILLGLIVIFVGSFISYCSAFAIYGFGIIVENAEENLSKAKNDIKSPTNTEISAESKTEEKTHWTCQYCGVTNSLNLSKCEICGKERLT